MDPRQPSARFDDVALRADVKAYLERWNISENEMARSLGMSTGNIHRWFRSETRMSPDYLASVAHICDLDLNNYVLPHNGDD